MELWQVLAWAIPLVLGTGGWADNTGLGQDVSGCVDVIAKCRKVYWAVDGIWIC